MSKPKSFFQNLIKPFKPSSTTDQTELDLETIAAQEQKHFSFKALAAATKNFHPSQKLGEGGFGPVFRGKLDNGREIAVKRLSQRSSQGKKEFQNEAKLLQRVQHKNVVNLLGYCLDDAERLLVYEYVPNESLDKLLFKSDRRELLDWKRRHEVIFGTAKGLLYLHEQAPCSIIHRDIKASNILLDDKWVPKIADFGLARLFPEDQTHIDTRVAGTNGYMAPEYLLQGILSKKADVFSFGVVVLELISGQKNSAFNRDPDSQSLLEWAFKLYKKHRSLEIMDPVLVSSADHNQIAVCVQIGLLCVQSEPHLRPDMDRVVVILSRKPTNFEEPIRPAYPGSSHRRSHPNKAGSSSLTGTSADASSSSGSFGSTTATKSAASFTGTDSTITGPRLDHRGKRPVKG